MGHRQDSTNHNLVTPVVYHMLEWELAEWVHHEWSIQWPIAPWSCQCISVDKKSLTANRKNVAGLLCDYELKHYQIFDIPVL